jgi:UDP-glucuronate 4-epimerase
VYASSSSVYGNAERYPTTELDRPQPVSPYGVTKLAAEHLCSLYGTNFGVPTTSLRYFTVYGPGQRPDMAFTRFLKAAEFGEELPLYGPGGQIRDFTFIDDVVDANVKAALSDTQPGSIYNVAGGSNVSMNDVLDIIGGLVDTPLRVNRTAAVAGDVWRTGGSTERIAQDLSWSPNVSIEDGIAAQLEWVRTLPK